MKTNQHHSLLVKDLHENKKFIKYLETKKKDPIESSREINRLIKDISRKQYKLKEAIKRSQHKYSLKHR